MFYISFVLAVKRTSQMTKKRKGKPTNGKQEAKVPRPDLQKDSIDPADKGGRPFDFGGLPDRDLKKNLGCG
jgi:hypothetical protein